MEKSIARDWFVSSHSAPANTCVQVRVHVDGSVDVRNSNYPKSGLTSFTKEEWTAFLAGAKGGEFDIA